MLPTTGVVVLVGVEVAVAIRVGGIGVLVRVGGTGVLVGGGCVLVAGSLVSVSGSRVTISVGLVHAAIKMIANKTNNISKNGLRNINPSFLFEPHQNYSSEKYYSTFKGGFQWLGKFDFSLCGVHVIKRVYQP